VVHCDGVGAPVRCTVHAKRANSPKGHASPIEIEKRRRMKLRNNVRGRRSRSISYSFLSAFIGYRRGGPWPSMTASHEPSSSW